MLQPWAVSPAPRWFTGASNLLNHVAALKSEHHGAEESLNLRVWCEMRGRSPSWAARKGSAADAPARLAEFALTVSSVASAGGWESPGGMRRRLPPAAGLRGALSYTHTEQKGSWFFISMHALLCQYKYIINIRGHTAVGCLPECFVFAPLCRKGAAAPSLCPHRECSQRGSSTWLALRYRKVKSKEQDEWLCAALNSRSVM